MKAQNTMSAKVCPNCGTRAHADTCAVCRDQPRLVWVVMPNERQQIQCFEDSEIGMTMGDTTVKQLPDGTWKATCPIGTIFGSEVEGECSGTGATKEAALEALAKDRRNLNDSLWA